MADKINRFQIRRGQNAPTATDLLNYEMGIAKDNETLYYRGNEDKIFEVARWSKDESDENGISAITDADIFSIISI